MELNNLITIFCYKTSVAIIALFQNVFSDCAIPYEVIMKWIIYNVCKQNEHSVLYP